MQLQSGFLFTAAQVQPKSWLRAADLLPCFLKLEWPLSPLHCKSFLSFKAQLNSVLSMKTPCVIQHHWTWTHHVQAGNVRALSACTHLHWAGISLMHPLYSVLLPPSHVEGWGWKRMKKNKKSLRDLRGTIKCANILITGVPEGGERNG